MIAIEINSGQLKQLREAVGKAKKSFGKELATVVNKVAKQTVKEIGKGIREHINMKAGDVKKVITVKPRATAANPVSEFSIQWHKRPGLQYFGARQNKSGVTYKISKKGGRTSIPGAFMGPRPGTLAPKLHGGVFQRIGKSRLPIAKLRGASVAGVFVKNNMEKPTESFIVKQLDHEMTRRIEFNVLRANGLIPTKKA
jgi:hypothetical protein